MGGSVFPVCFIRQLFINHKNIRNKSIMCSGIAFFEVLIGMCVWVGNWVWKKRGECEEVIISA